MAGKGIKQVFATRLTDVDTVDREGVGTLRIEGTRWYKYVQINNSTGTSAGVAGDLVGYRASAAGGYNNSIVCINAAGQDAVPDSCSGNGSCWEAL